MSAAIPVIPADASVLVTGAAGMLGRALSARLVSAGCNARLMIRRADQANLLPADAEAIVGDITDPEAVERALDGVSVVLHLAAATGGDRASFERTNVGGTLNIVAECLRRESCRLVHVSSIGVLDHAGHSPERGPLREDAALEPFPERRGLYTQTKLAAETLVRAAIRDRGLRAVILRPGQIFGPGSEAMAPNGVVPLRGWNLVGNGRALLPLVYADDVVDALLLAAFRDGIEGMLFHVVDGTPVTQNEYLAAWRRRVRDVPLRRIPFPLAMSLATLAEGAAALLGRSAPLTRYRVRSLHPLSGFDTEHAAKVLGWSPRIGTLRGLDLCFPATPVAPARP